MSTSESNAANGPHVNPQPPTPASLTKITPRIVILSLIGTAVVASLLTATLGKLLPGVGISKPPSHYVGEAVGRFYRQYFVCGDDIDLRDYQVINISSERHGDRNVVLYEIRATGVFNKDYEERAIGGKLLGTYRKGDQRTVDGRLIFWREGSRWYCSNPEDHFFPTTLNWPDR
jgi:hypothetical protein